MCDGKKLLAETFFISVFATLGLEEKSQNGSFYVVGVGSALRLSQSAVRKRNPRCQNPVYIKKKETEK